MAGVANTAGLSGGGGGGLGAPHGGGNLLASSDNGSLHKAGDRDTQVTNGLQDAAASRAQLEDELVFKGGRDVMVWTHGPKAQQGQRTPLGRSLLNPNKIRFVRVWLLRCYVSSLYINRGWVTGVRHRVFSKGLALTSLLYPCLGGVMWSVAPSRRRGSEPRSILCLLSIQQQCFAILLVSRSVRMTGAFFSTNALDSSNHQYNHGML
jgi:hypothetical protein